MHPAWVVPFVVMLSVVVLFAFVMQVIHHTNKHSTRYQIDHSHKNALATELRKGGTAIDKYVRKEHST
jgi:hypothetical protein